MLVFIDYNDVCRAPLAAKLYTQIHGKQAYSAGVYADEGAKLCDEVRPALLDGHTSRKLTVPMLEQANEIWCVTAAIARHLTEQQPQYAYKIHAMQEISDPFGMGSEAYQQCVQQIRIQVEAMP